MKDHMRHIAGFLRGTSRFRLTLLSIVFAGISAGAQENIVMMPDYPSQNPIIDTLRVGFFKETNPDLSFWGREYPIYSDFYSKGDEDSIEIIPGSPEMNYKTWIQKKNAPIILLLPGTAINFRGESPVALAQMFYNKGFSVVTISSAFNWEFMQSASTVDIPGYVPQDAADVRTALEKIMTRLDSEHPGKITSRALAGYSLGALHTLFIADIYRSEGKEGFARYVAINPPVNLMYAMKKIDKFYERWTSWPPNEIQQNMSQAADAYSKVIFNATGPDKSLDVKTDQAQFIIGYSFRTMLTEAIFSIHMRGKSMGIIKEPYRWIAREKIYREIRDYSFEKYINSFVIKYFSEKFGREVGIEELNEKSSLAAITGTLTDCPDLRIYHNMDDFLLSGEDRKWLAGIMKGRITFFEHGGHLGNLHLPEVQRHILDGVIDLLPPPEPQQAGADKSQSGDDSAEAVGKQSR